MRSPGSQHQTCARRLCLICHMFRFYFSSDINQHHSFLNITLDLCATSTLRALEWKHARACICAERAHGAITSTQKLNFAFQKRCACALNVDRFIGRQHATQRSTERQAHEATITAAQRVRAGRQWEQKPRTKRRYQEKGPARRTRRQEQPRQHRSLKQRESQKTRARQSQSRQQPMPMLKLSLAQLEVNYASNCSCYV